MKHTSGSITFAIVVATLVEVVASVAFFFGVVVGAAFFGVALTLDFMSSF